MPRESIGFVRMVWYCPNCQSKNPGNFRFCRRNSGGVLSVGICRKSPRAAFVRYGRFLCHNSSSPGHPAVIVYYWLRAGLGNFALPVFFFHQLPEQQNSRPLLDCWLSPASLNPADHRLGHAEPVRQLGLVDAELAADCAEFFAGHSSTWIRSIRI